MIEFDQPRIFADKIVTALSSVEDGDMKFGSKPDEEVRLNREQFLARAGIDLLQTTLVNVSYQDNTNFTRYLILDEDHQGQGMSTPGSLVHADAVVVTRPGHAIFLPLADCVGAIIYDPRNQIMMVSHLGRHSLEQNGAARSIEFLIDGFDSDPAELLVWLSPAASQGAYPLYSFNNRGLIDVTSEHMMRAGVDPNNVEISAIDTATSPEYNSHSQYLAGERDDDGRFAIAAMMVE